jgi:hypothetical protein
MTNVDILLWMTGLLLTAGLGVWVGQSRDKSKKETEDLAKVVREVEQLKVTAVSEPRVREIIKDAIEPMSQDVKEAKASLIKINEILQHIQIDIAAENAFKRGKNSSNKED